MKECANEDCCEDLAHTMMVRVCQFCKKVIAGNFGCKLCSKCSTLLNECAHCRSKLVDDD